MGEVELSSALAPLSRCHIASPLASVPSPPRKCIPQMLSACRRAEYVASSSLGVPEQSGAAHRHEHVEHEHDMHGSMAGRSRADLRWQAHPSQAKGASARAPSNFVPALVLAIESACRSGSGGRARSTTRTALDVAPSIGGAQMDARAPVTPWCWLPCAPEPRRGPSTRVCLFSRKHKRCE